MSKRLVGGIIGCKDKVCPQNKLHSWGSFQPLKFLRRTLFHIVDLVGNHLDSSIFTFFLAYVICDLFHHLLPKYYLTLS